MKTLKFAPHLVEKILSGEKTATWRLFDDKDLQKGDDLTFSNKETGEQFGTATITSLKTTTLGSLTDDDRAGHEKYSSDEEMYASFRKYYGDKVDENSEVKILTFDFKSSASKSLGIARQLLGKEVEVTFDRPLGSKHPKHGFVYEVNYGFIEGIMSPDGEELDAYYLGVEEPLQKAVGKCIAIVHRIDNDDDKLVVAPAEQNFTDEEIMQKVHFQEQWFKSEVVRV